MSGVRRQCGGRWVAIGLGVATIGGVPCVRSLRELRFWVGGVVIVVPPTQTRRVLYDVLAMAIPRVWMQQGAESDEAVAYCREHGIDVVERECLLMFLQGTAFYHRAHRWLRGVTTGLPR